MENKSEITPKLKENLSAVKEYFGDKWDLVVIETLEMIRATMHLTNEKNIYKCISAIYDYMIEEEHQPHVLMAVSTELQLELERTEDTAQEVNPEHN